ncbi:Clp protease [Acinetobacter sp. HY1485]|uniref:COG4648 family protein n=1 Tax=Acinetobacter sp. HY1485 TaxID=2970918 RepID=UPI0022B9B44C|nr:Clp protease [Acinetobacter sp. HY1485]
MRRLIQLLSGVLLVAYPFLMGWCLAHGYLWQVSSLLLGLGIIRLFTQKKSALAPLTWLAILCGGLSLIMREHTWLQFYPIAMSLGALSIFAYTLYRPPSMIERFARMFEPDLPPHGVIWTKQVTKVWCVFFALNATVALITVFMSMHAWVLYNGFISYLIMGVLLAGEFILRKKQQRIHNETC